MGVLERFQAQRSRIVLAASRYRRRLVKPIRRSTCAFRPVQDSKICILATIQFRSVGPVRRHLKKVMPQIGVRGLLCQLGAIGREAHALKLKLSRVIRHVAAPRNVNEA